jgi:hypothetical protein
MIVKVQVSMFTSAEEQTVLVYNKDKSVMFQGEATPKVLKMMAGRFKAFFKARMRGKEIDIIKPAKWQDW